MNKGLDFKDELTKNDFRYISLVWVSVNQFFLVLLSKYLLILSKHSKYYKRGKRRTIHGST